jgi:branched-subunit amino acid transport protein
MSEPIALWLLVALGIAATYVWRGLGVLVAARLDPDGPFVAWVTCVSYAMLAGLVARMVVMPLGALADTPLADRLIATAVGFAAFYLTRKRILPGVGAGVGAFILLQVVRGG